LNQSNTKQKRISFDTQAKTALLNLLFNSPQLTHAKIVIRTFVPGGQKQLTTDLNRNATIPLDKVTNG